MSDLAPRAAARARTAVILTVLAAALALPAAAGAGTYSVPVCDGTGANRAFQPFGDTAFVAAEPWCRPQYTGSGFQSGGVRVRNSVNAPGQSLVAPLYTTGGLRAQAPPGTVITRLRGSATAWDDLGSTFAEGWRAGIADDVTPLWCGFHLACSWGGPPMVGIDLTPTAGATRLDLTVTCALWTGCQRDRLRGVVNLDAATIDLDDRVAPAVSAAGNGWSTGWVTGAVTAAVRATDGAGVRRTWFAIDGGAAQGQATYTCDAYAMAPCPADTGTASAQLSLVTLGDGAHTLELRAEDAGGNAGVATVPLRVDNQAPVVSSVATLTARGWHRVNAFDLRVTAADPAGGSGVRSLSWEVCREDGSDCVPGRVEDLSAPTVRIAVPAAGTWRARFWAADALRSGVKSEWSAPLRFDDTVPGAAAITGAGAWTRAAEPAVGLELPGGEAVGPSGIGGYAVTLGGEEPGTSVVVEGERPAVSLGALPEGETTVRARAISGAGVAAVRTARATVRVDRTAPLVGVARDPDGADTDWIGRETRVAVHAQDALSGMDAAPAAAADDAGGRIVYAVDGGEPVTVRGADATIAVDATGDHAIALRAFDAAGNGSRERILRVRVDRTAPAGELLPFESAQPRRARAAIDDVCVRSAELQIRRRGATTWTVVDATLDGAEAWADVPDDRLAPGAYDVRFRVEDCAGNVGLITRFASQSAASAGASLRLPLRARLSLGAAFAGDDPAAGPATAVVRMGTGVRITGQLADADGTVVGGRVLLVQQRIGTGDWRTVATPATDAAGAVSVALPAGPSRALRIVAEPDELTVGAVSRTLRVAVPARATIKVARRQLRNGQAARFSGRVLGGYLPAGGRELELQGFNPLRGRWQPVRTSGLRSDGRGAWHASYRFTATRGTVRYRFRLRVPPRPDHPFADGYSRAVTVVVTG